MVVKVQSGSVKGAEPSASVVASNDTRKQVQVLSAAEVSERCGQVHMQASLLSQPVSVQLQAITHLDVLGFVWWGRKAQEDTQILKDEKGRVFESS